MHRFAQAGLALTGLLFAGILFSSCNLYPGFGGWTVNLEIQSAAKWEGSGGRLISPDARKVTVLLHKGGTLQAEASASLPAAGPDGPASVTLGIPGVVEGQYTVSAFAEDSEGRRVQTASGLLDFKPGVRGSSLTLRLIPNETEPGVVVPLGVGMPSGPQAIAQKTSGYVKLAVPEDMSLWTDAPGFSLQFQLADGGTAPKNLVNQGSSVARGAAVSKGTYWVYYFYDGLQPLQDFSYYVDTYDSQGNPVDRRPLLQALEAGGLLLAEAADETKRGPETGKFPTDESLFLDEMNALAAAISGSADFLPPNYLLSSTAALVQAENTLKEKTAALDARRNGGPLVIPVTGVVVSPGALTLETGETGNLTAEVSPAEATDKTVVWSSSDTTVAVVDADGKVTAVKAGTAEIKAATPDGAYFDTVAVTVVDPVIPVKGITVSPETLTLEVGETGNLTAEVSPAEATDKTVVWSSSDPLVAEVDSAGNVTAIMAGTVEIKAETADGGFTDTVTVTVNPHKGGSDITVVPVNPADPALGLSVEINSTPASGPLTLGPTDELTVTLVEDSQTLVVLYWIADQAELALPAPDGKVLVLTGGDFVVGPHELTVFYRTDPSDGKTYSLSLSFTVTE